MLDEQLYKSTLTKKQIWGIIITVLFIIICLFLNWLFLHCQSDTTRGTFGDMFGAVNALFTGLAFAGVVLTIILQRNELKIQQQELKNSKDELDSSKTDAAKQKMVLDQQRFETTFFNMMNLQNEIIKNIQHNGNSGRGVFDGAYENLITILYSDNSQSILKRTTSNTHLISVIPNSISNARALLLNNYFPGYYDNYSSSLNHYFRNLYHIFKFIYFSELELEDKKFYAALCRAQLSQNELFAISFNILIEGYGRPKLLYLVKEFEILKNFETEKIQPNIYWLLIKDEINKIEYPFKNREKPKNRKIL